MNAVYILFMLFKEWIVGFAIPLQSRKDLLKLLLSDLVNHIPKAQWPLE
jgi:hypothetical protein